MNGYDDQLMDLAKRYCTWGEVPQDRMVRVAIKDLFRRHGFYLVSSVESDWCSVEEAFGRVVFTWPD
jgi:hypothetical protein